jgi:hypothetical protein
MGFLRNINDKKYKINILNKMKNFVKKSLNNILGLENVTKTATSVSIFVHYMQTSLNQTKIKFRDDFAKTQTTKISQN